MKRIFCFSFLIVLIHYCFGGDSSDRIERDLRSYDFQKEPPLSLNGDWELYYNRLVFSPKSIESANFQVITLPKRWEQIGLNEFGYASYRLTILLNTDVPLALKIPDLFSSFKLYINGLLMDSAGIVAEVENEYSPERKVKYVNIPSRISELDSMEIVIQVANFTHSKGGIGTVPILGSRDQIFEEKFLNDGYDLFLTGALVMGCLFFVGLYFYGRKEWMTLYFALFCFAYAYRVIGWGNYVLHDIVDIPYWMAIRLEYATFYLCAFFFTKYLINLFPKETPKLLASTFGYISLLWALSTLLPVSIFSRLNTYFLYILLGGLLIVAFVFVKAVMNKRPGAKMAIYSTLAIFVIFFMKSLAYIQVIEEVSFISMLGEMFFFFFQALILSKYFILTWKEAKVEAEQIAKTKADFLSVMSHEIRTPLNALIGTTYHMLDSKPRIDQKNDLNNLKSASENLLNLVNNILDFNKIEQNKLELELSEVRLKSYLKSQISIFKSSAKRKGIYLDFEYDSDLPRVVKIDKGRIGQIVNNLIGNAIKFTHEGGVTLHVSNVGDHRGMVKIKFEIMDTGIGIKPEEIGRVFQTFEQANTKISGEYGGTGLGLAISKKLLEHMGSEIDLQSVEGQGTQFSFVLSLEPIATEPVEEKITKRQNLVGCELLLVEDNAMNVMIAKRFLHKWEIDVDVAENGQVAVDMIEQDNYYDIILMDLQMPVMNGYDAAKRIRALGFDKPILALTASAISETELKAKGGEMIDFITKPYKPDDLYNKIKHYLDEE